MSKTQIPSDRFIQPSPAIVGAVVTISGDKGAGTGFFANIRGKVYIATNQHVLGVGPRLTIRTSSGEAVIPKQIFTAADADIALIECVTIPSAVTAIEVAILPDSGIVKDDPVSVLGNSKGDGVITQTDGKLIAIGPQRIEVDNPGYPGNSGSPIIHTASGKSIGVFTEAELLTFNSFEKASFKSKNSAIKSEIRYFGHRIDSVQKWEPLNWNAFQENLSLIALAKEELRAILGYYTESSDGYKNFRDLHVARSAAAKIFYDPTYSNSDHLAAFQRFLRDVDFLARRAYNRFANKRIYFSQQRDIESIKMMVEAVGRGTAVAKRDSDLTATLLDRGGKDSNR